MSPLDRKFLDECQPLFKPGMGTESAAFLLYGMVRMARPRNLLEVGLGYTTPFLACALINAQEEFEADRRMLEHFPITRGHSRQPRNSFRIPLV